MFDIPPHHIETIKAAVAEVAAAEDGRQDITEALTKARCYAQEIHGRQSDLVARRQQIIQRRQIGETHPEDGSEMALLDADLEGLQAILADAVAAEALAKQLDDKAAAVITNAQAKQRAAETAAHADALVAHATKLDGLLLQTIAQMDEVGIGRKAGVRPAWGASAELRDALRTLQIRRGDY